MSVEKSAILRWLKKIPQKTLENIAFYLVMAMLVIHVIEAFIRAFFGKRAYYEMFELVGIIAVIFVLVLFATILVQEEKNALKMFKEMKIWDKALLVMLLWSVVSALLADNYETAFCGSVYRNEGLTTYFKYAAFYICAVIIKEERKKKYIVQGMVLMITILSLVSVGQCVMGKTGEFTAYAGTLENINHFAYLLTIGIMLCAGMYLTEQNKTRKIVALCVYALKVWSLIVNQTMGGYVAVCFGIVFLSIIMLQKDKTRKKDVVILIACFIIINVATNMLSGVLVRNLQESMYGITDEGLTDAAGSGRIGLWKQAIVYIGERPIFGFGPEGLNEPYAKDGFTNVRPHNEYLQHAAYLGIPGACFYLVALFSLFLNCVKNLKKQDAFLVVLGGAIFGYCVSAFFGNTFYYTAVYYFILLGMLSGYCKIKH